jgi:hypothetical protein
MMRRAVRIALGAKRGEEERGREKEADSDLSLVLVVSNGLVRLKATQRTVDGASIASYSLT